MIDCDVHCAPASFADISPYLDESWHGYVDEAGIQLSALSGGAYPPGIPPAPSTYEQLAAELLDRTEPELAVLNCLTLYGVHRNPYYSAAVASALNDWLAEEWLERDERLRASLVVSTLDVDAAVAEIDRRGADYRFVQVLLPVRSEVPYGNVRYHPIHEAAVRNDLAIGVHAWGRAGQAPGVSGITRTYIEDYMANCQVAQTQVASLVSEGVFDRFPDLRVVLSECGFSWLPSLLWRFDKDWKGVWREVPWVREKPSEYVRRHVRATIEPAGLPRADEARTAMLEMVGPELLMYASDHPHDHGDSATAMLAALAPETRQAIETTNPAAFYQLQ